MDMKQGSKAPTDGDVIEAGYLPAIETLRLGNLPFTLSIRYDDGAELTTDMTGVIFKRQAFAVLRDADAFARVRVINDGDGVAWEAGPDFSADALRHLALTDGQGTVDA